MFLKFLHLLIQFMALSVPACRQTHQVFLTLLQVGWTNKDVVFSARYCSLVLPGHVCHVLAHTGPAAYSVVLLSVSESETSHLSALHSGHALNDFCTCSRSTCNQSTDITIHFQPSCPMWILVIGLACSKWSRDMIALTVYRLCLPVGYKYCNFSLNELNKSPDSQA